MSLAPLNCPKIPLCITHLVVFWSPSAVPSSLEKSGKCPSSSLNSCRAPEYWGQKIRKCLAVCRPRPQLQRGDRTEGSLAGKRKESRQLIPVLSWMASKLSAFLSPSWSCKTSVPGGASTKSWLGGLFAEDCHCCNQRVLILRFALVELVTGRLGSS